jgi:hypothetical protein
MWNRERLKCAYLRVANRFINLALRHESPTGARCVFEDRSDFIFIATAFPQSASCAEKPIVKTFASSGDRRKNIESPLRQ